MGAFRTPFPQQHQQQQQPMRHPLTQEKQEAYRSVDDEFGDARSDLVIAREQTRFRVHDLPQKRITILHVPEVRTVPHRLLHCTLLRRLSSFSAIFDEPHARLSVVVSRRRRGVEALTLSTRHRANHVCHVPGIVVQRLAPCYIQLIICLRIID
jgi:hypothetical protein